MAVDLYNELADFGLGLGFIPPVWVRPLLVALCGGAFLSRLAHNHIFGAGQEALDSVRCVAWCGDVFPLLKFAI